MTLLARFWPHVLVVLAIGAIGWQLHHRGYKAGEAAREAFWAPRFHEAEKRAAEAEGRAKALQAASRAISDEWERRYADSTAALNARAADADLRIRGLVRQLSTRPRCDDLPTPGGPAGLPDAPAPGDELIARAGERFAGVGLRCEADAEALAALQAWIRDQLAILGSP